MNYLKQLYRFFNPKFQNVFLDYRVHNHPRYGHGLPNHPGLESLIAKGIPTYKETLNQINQYKELLWSLEERMDDHLPFSWRNDYFPGLDTAMLYTMIATKRPSHYVEVGSGISTMIAAQAKKDHNLKTRIVSVDPKPRKEISDLVDQHFASPLEQQDPSLFRDLNAGDFLFIDNSHRILPNSDSTVFFLDVLPILKTGVIVHIHDIYWPSDYPQFMCDRFYSEQYGLAIALLSNPERFSILAPNFYMSQQQELSSIVNEFWKDSRVSVAEQHGGSFWMRIN